MKNLSKQELSVLNSIKEGNKNREIATSLGINEKTVSTYILRLKKKLGVPNDANTYKLVTSAINMKLFPEKKNSSYMNNSKTQRGFDITEFKDTYGAKCSLQMSSSAMEDKIWLGVNDADPKIMVSKAHEHGLEPQGHSGWMTFPIPKDVLLNTRMHLNREQVAELLPYLKRFVETGRIHE